MKAGSAAMQIVRLMCECLTSLKGLRLPMLALQVELNMFLTKENKPKSLHGVCPMSIFSRHFFQLAHLLVEVCVGCAWGFEKNQEATNILHTPWVLCRVKPLQLIYAAISIWRHASTMLLCSYLKTPLRLLRHCVERKGTVADDIQL